MTVSIKPTPVQQAELRNIAIIAHVDHGKTTLVDGLLKQANIFRDPDAAGELIMDASDLERERGITILSKNAAIVYAGVKINIIDTPGHADFGGEVERVLNMADGCLLLVDAVEGPMPQTRAVLGQALALGLKPIVVVNKVDRPIAQPDVVVSRTQDLFLDLATEPDQLDFPVVYTIAREGRAGLTSDGLADDLRPLLDMILQVVPKPDVDPDGPFQVQIASLGFDPHRGRIAIGRIKRGYLSVGDMLAHVDANGEIITQKVSSINTFEGLSRKTVETAVAGDIIALTGFPDAKIGATITDPAHPDVLPAIAIQEPTLKLTFGVNTSPLAGREGEYSTSRQLRERLFRELETNYSLRVAATDQADVFSVSGRGELHLSILIDTMRREGYEFQVSRPEVITKVVDGEVVEPVEHLVIDTIEEFVGAVTELVGNRRARMLDMVNDGRGHVRLEFSIPTRGLIGLRNAFLTGTKGNGSMASMLTGYEPWQGDIVSNRTGALVASEGGTALTHGIANSQVRGTTFVAPGTEVYEGMIVGQQPRQEDLPINICRAKKLTNMRASSADSSEKLTPPTILSLEQSLDFLSDDELLEVTPLHLRLRKRLLTHDERNRVRKQAASRAQT
ncbi:MAG: translational GTPase TypA [Chloroflexia bacterium]|nr:translational GTPase TypA [Chloroflexia bacterium]